jgi:hypothetical protein
MSKMYNGKVNCKWPKDITKGLYNCVKCKGKMFPLQTRLWPRGWVEV